MEQFYEKPTSLSVSITVIRILAFVDVFASISYFFLILIWPQLTPTYTYIIVFNIFHLFSWMAGIGCASDIYAHEYILMCSMVYIVAFFGDMGSMIWRSVIYQSGHIYQGSAIFLNVILLIVDVLMVIFVSNSLTQTRNFKDKIIRTLKSQASSNLETETFRKVPFRLYSARHSIKMISTLDLFLFLLLALMFSLGLSLTNMFQALTILQIPHSFLWIAGVAIEKNIQEVGFVIFFTIMYGIALLLDATSVIWRIIIASQCTNCSFMIVFGWIMIGIGSAMMIFSCIQIYFGVVVIKNMFSEFNRLLPMVKTKLVMKQRFYE